MAQPQRYHSLAIILHWVMAVGFLLMLGSGFLMVNAPLEQFLQFQLYQWHKAGGVLLLCAFGLRLLLRFIQRQPALPAHLPTCEKRGAKLGHLGLYSLMLAMPFTGWVMVSSSVYGLPTMVFGWFEWPHIPGLAGNATLNTNAKTAHFYLALIFSVMIAVHILAVVKHMRLDGINLLRRMWWGKPKMKEDAACTISS